MTTRLLTVPEAAEQLRCSPYTIRRWLREGELVGERHGGNKHGGGRWRIPVEAIADYRAAHSNTAVRAGRGRGAA